MFLPLVSIISPCYNVAPYVARFLDSLIAQTYRNLEIILINDGATDNTGDIIQSYIPRLKEEGYKVIYKEQENGGQSSAINNALKLVTGQFLTWPDPDDWLTPDSIEKRVLFLQNHPDVGLVRCNIEKIDAETGSSLGVFENNIQKAYCIENAFEKLVFVQTWFAPVAYMARSYMFDKAVSNREIYVSKRAGQNWQMMLPITYIYPMWQMPEILGYYCVRQNSHSHSAVSVRDLIRYSEVSENVLINTLINIKAPQKTINEVHKKYAIEQFAIAATKNNILLKWKYFKIAIKWANEKEEKIILWKNLLPNFINRYVHKVVRMIKHEK